ncbi:MAG TPA: S53 family peptidase [Solirubrobacteraceae bacterium]|nr:S53 family peptidase [Solirubrobacteraceae bacterium]
MKALVSVGRLGWRALAGLVAVLAFALVGAGGAAASTTAKVRAHVSAQSMTQIRGSLLPTTATKTGTLSSRQMSVEVVLAPGNESGLNSLLSDLYTPGSAEYGHWLAAGQFDSEFAPSQTTVQSITGYLQSQGLTVQRTLTPFLLRAVGSSAQIDAAFATSLENYRNARGVNFYSNATPASVPASLASSVLGVVGLSNTVRLQSQTSVEAAPAGSAGHGPGEPSCEIPYPTTLAQLEAIPTNGPFNGYGGGPGCSGLTPSQTNSIYNAPDAGPRAQGAGANVAVFELSAYNHSDIANWAHTFYGSHYTPHLVDINVDGGPLATNTSQCPSGDTCFYGYGGDIEIEADIEQDLTIAPDANRVLVYNAPNDETGQVNLDEFATIANQDVADTVSSSWAICEPDTGLGYAEAENILFEQMAAQGQSMFAASGDTGAFECIRDGTFSDYAPLESLDPASQPWVTSTGGTSFESFDPGSNPNPNYPFGTEAVWNTLDVCSGNNSSTATSTGIVDCGAYGAGGGGHSIFWPMPNYQRGPGVINPYTVSGPSNCALARKGQPCREQPDISANADPLTGYAELCTGSSYVSPNPTGPDYESACYGLTKTPGAPGWLHIGGTSLSAPLFAALFTDRDAFHGHRSGSANPLLYSLFDNPFTDFADFHDITGFRQVSNNNGFYPVTPGFDEATGIGTPNFAGLITGSGF